MIVLYARWALLTVARGLLWASAKLDTEPPAITIHKVSYRQPLAGGLCNHGRRVLFNLSVGVIFHDDNSRCDGWVVSR